MLGSADAQGGDMLGGEASNLDEEAKPVTEGLDSCCNRRGFLNEAERVRLSRLLLSGSCWLLLSASCCIRRGVLYEAKRVT